MLTHLCITNFAIIESLDLDVIKGFTVVTGETGAGKSIIVDAINFALGARVDAQTLGPYGTRAEVSLSFDLTTLPTARAWLTAQDLDASEEECVLRRVLGQDGRSRAYINGQTVPLQQLKGLGEFLVDIHGQHEHQSLLRRDVHAELLDHYAGATTLALEVRAAHQHWKQLRDELTALERATQEATARREFLQFQLHEIESLELDDGELATLDDEHRRLANSDKLARGAETALQRLDDDDQAVLSQLGQQLREIETLAEFDTQLAPMIELLRNAEISVQETINALRRYVSSLDAEPDRLAQIEQRISAIHHLARKHRVAPDALTELMRKLSDELAGLTSADERLQTLPGLVDEAKRHYQKQARTLTAQRRRAAPELQQQIEALIRTLGMPNATMRIVLTPVPDDEPAATGSERAEFLVSANAGFAPAPLGKVASGGELSRISLAIQVATAHTTGIPTLIFDEVDTGVGGSVAEAIGKQLRALGEHRQVFAVTHLPQVAALGHHHLRASKSTHDGMTRTALELLPDNERREEIARMLGGAEITKQTRAHAKEMLTRAAGG